jgi:hypothetical protein
MHARASGRLDGATELGDHQTLNRRIRPDVDQELGEGSRSFVGVELADPRRPPILRKVRRITIRGGARAVRAAT